MQSFPVDCPIGFAIAVALVRLPEYTRQTKNVAVFVLTFWSNCKLGVKLQSAFALVMLLFVAALIGVGITVAQIAAAQGYETTQLLPARDAALNARALFRTADDDGSYYVIETDPKVAAGRLATYRADVVTLAAEIAAVEKFANTEEQRKAVADYHAFMDGPNGYFQGEEQSFKEKAAGQYARALKDVIATSPLPPVNALIRYAVDIDAKVTTGNQRINVTRCIRAEVGDRGRHFGPWSWFRYRNAPVTKYCTIGERDDLGDGGKLFRKISPISPRCYNGSPPAI